MELRWQSLQRVGRNSEAYCALYAILVDAGFEMAAA
jgi:hypothetical protein